jgi:hypothetical protein
LAVVTEEGLYSTLGNYLLILYQRLTKLIANYDDSQESFEGMVQRVAKPLRNVLVRRLSLETFWREDRVFD